MVQCECHGKIFDSEESLQNHLDLQDGKLTDRAVLAILDAIRKGVGPLTAARRAGVPTEVWQREVKQNTLLQEAIKLAEMELAETVEEALLEAAQGGEFRSAQLFLERRSPDRWSAAPDKVEISIVESVRQLPLGERLEKLTELLANRTELPSGNVIDVEVLDE